MCCSSVERVCVCDVAPVIVSRSSIFMEGGSGTYVNVGTIAATPTSLPSSCTCATPIPRSAAPSCALRREAAWAYSILRVNEPRTAINAGLTRARLGRDKGGLCSGR